MKTKQDVSTLHIACAIDDAFSYPMAVMLISLFENNIQNKIKIHLFSAALSREFIELFDNLTLSYKQQFKFYELTHEHFKNFPTNDRISFASYYRLVIPEIIEIDTEKFLYLDADIVIAGDLKPLFELNLESKMFGAVNDISAIEQKMYIKHKIPEEYLYFNAGVLLIYKKRWNQKKATMKVLNYIENNKNLCLFHDQDGLNASLFSERQNILPVWNQQIGIFFTDKKLLEYVYPKGLNLAISKPIIIHFNGGEKPWHQVSAHPFKKDFKKYAKKLKGIHYQEPWNLKKQIKRFLLYGILGWINVNRYYNQQALKKNHI